MSEDSPSIASRLGTEIMCSLLGHVRAGSLVVRLSDGTERTYSGTAPGPDACIEITDPALPRRILTGGGMALAEGYMEGAWDTPDLYALLSFALANEPRGALSAAARRIAAIVSSAAHAWPDNDLDGAKQNIRYHYDLGNEFYELWLDPTMTYSAGCFDEAALSSDPLRAAQLAKWNRVLELIQPSRTDHILEIGCGWGGFAVHAAKESGCRVTALTLSQAQAAFASRRVEQEGLEGLVDVRLQDYRQTPGTYDGVASIEMFEAVGTKWWPVFFERLRQLLAPGHAAGIQVITIADEHFESYRDSEDFIRRYIFPGGMLPSPERFSAAARAAGFVPTAPYFFGADYSATLVEWLKRFDASLDAVRALGFDERFIRMWRYYLQYCRVGFDTGNTNVMHVRLEG